MFPSSMRLQQVKPYLRGIIVIALTAVVVGIAIMYGPGPHLSHAQTTPPQPVPGGGGCTVTAFTVPAGADSSWQLQAVQSQGASIIQDECNIDNWVNWSSGQIDTLNAQVATLNAEVAALQAKLNVTPPAPPVTTPPPTTPPPTTGVSGWLGADALTGTLAVGQKVTVNASAGPVRSAAAGSAAPVSPQPATLVGATVTIIGGPTTNGIVWWQVQF